SRPKTVARRLLQVGGHRRTGRLMVRFAVASSPAVRAARLRLLNVRLRRPAIARIIIVIKVVVARDVTWQLGSLFLELKLADHPFLDHLTATGVNRMGNVRV